MKQRAASSYLPLTFVGLRPSYRSRPCPPCLCLTLRTSFLSEHLFRCSRMVGERPSPCWHCAPGENSTPHRARLTRAAHAILVVCTRLKFWSPAPDRIVGLQFLRALNVIPSHSCFDPQLSPHFSSPFPTLAPGSSATPSLLCPSANPSTATLQGGLCLGRLGEQSLLTCSEPKSLIEVSSEHTPMILPSRGDSLDTNLDDLLHGRGGRLQFFRLQPWVLKAFLPRCCLGLLAEALSTLVVAGRCRLSQDASAQPVFRPSCSGQKLSTGSSSEYSHTPSSWVFSPPRHSKRQPCRLNCPCLSGNFGRNLGKLVGEGSSNAQIRTLLDEQRQMIIAEHCEKIGRHELQAARVEEERRILQEELWRQQKRFFVKFTNKALRRWRNYENSKVLPSIRSQDGSSSRTRTLLWNYQVEYKNLK